MGRTTVWLPGGAEDTPASRLKLVLNNWVLALTAATGEAMAMAKALDVDPDRFFAALEGGALDNPYLRMKAVAIREGDFTPNFTVAGAAKDLDLIVAAAEGMDVATAAAARFHRAAAQGHAQEDMAAGYFASWD